VTGFEPVYTALQAAAYPLSHTRIASDYADAGQRMTVFESR
jgi:hypothetical protein